MSVGLLKADHLRPTPPLEEGETVSLRWLRGNTRASALPTPHTLVRAVYIGRACIAVAIYLAAALKFKVAAPLDILVTSFVLVATAVVTIASYWHTHVRGRAPGLTFLYSQALFDVALVTTVVHVTGGPQSDLTSLYVPLIAVTAVLMPPRSAALITTLVGLVYIADVFFGHSTPLTPDVAIQLAVFVAVAAVTAHVASRVQLVGGEREAPGGGVRAMRVEAVVRRSDRTFPIGVTTTTLDGAPGEGPRVTAIFSDISDSKRLERLRLRTERLEAVAELSSSLAHEIKNPLASIRSSVEQLARASRANPDEKFLTSLIVRESDRLARLLSEFLDFSRVRVTECRPLDLHQVAGAAIRLVREHPDCPADARIELLGDRTPMEGDEDLLHRVVSNLVLNAVQAAGKEARVTVRTGRPEPHQLPGGAGIDNPVALAVNDNGPGIPENVRARLFEPFVTGRVGGTGLGLAIVQRAVDAHRGLVLVDSTLGQGTTFTVYFPAARRREEAA